MMSERTIYMICCPMMIAAAIFTAVIWHTDAKAKNAPCEASVASDDKVTNETAKIDLRPVLASSTAMSGMPCENREQFERWYEGYRTSAREDETDESETSDETEEGLQECGASGSVLQTETETDEAADTESEPVHTDAPIYSVNGETLSPDFQRWIYGKLSEAGIEYWYESLLCTMYQESHFIVRNVSKDGRDYGIMQYRAEFWNDVSAQYGFPGADIYDPYVQVAIYIKQTAERINSGISGAEVLTRHKTSDWGVYDQQYYNEVSQWFDTIERIDE